MAKTNITLKLDKDLVKKARVLAAEEGSSVSALLAAKLEEMVRERDDYERAKRHALALMDRGFHLGGKPATREELHERR
jgi:hypothetical protein